MRKRRRLSAGYRSGYPNVKKKKYKKLLIRTAFVIIAAAVITGLAILLGTHLNKRAESAISRTVHGIGSIDTESETQEQKPADPYQEGVKSSSNAKTLKVIAADISITDNRVEDIENQIHDLSDKYNAVSIRLTESGRLVYVSPAVLDYARLPADAVSPVTQSQSQTPQYPQTSDDGDGNDEKPFTDPYENLKAAVSAAKNKNLRVCALYSTSVLSSYETEDINASSDAKTLDGIIIKELASLGFDEVIIDGLAEEDEGISNEKTSAIISYFANLRKSAGEIDIGVVLPYSIYVDAPSAGDINKLSEYADVLAIKIGSNANGADDAYQAIYDLCYPLKGNFSAYNIRGIILDSTPENAEASYAALKNLADVSAQFSVYVKNPSYSQNGSNGNQPDADGGTSNPNALTGNDYSGDVGGGNET